MRSQILVQAPGENLAKTRPASVTIYSSPGLNQIEQNNQNLTSQNAGAAASRAVIRNPLCGVRLETPQGIANNCG
jgi:hypothetical protein